MNLYIHCLKYIDFVLAEITIGIYAAVFSWSYPNCDDEGGVIIVWICSRQRRRHSPSQVVSFIRIQSIISAHYVTNWPHTITVRSLRVTISIVSKSSERPEQFKPPQKLNQFSGQHQGITVFIQILTSSTSWWCVFINKSNNCTIYSIDCLDDILQI